MLSFVIETYKEYREIKGIQEELEYALRNLDPDETYEFMRP